MAKGRHPEIGVTWPWQRKKKEPEKEERGLVPRPEKRRAPSFFEWFGPKLPVPAEPTLPAAPEPRKPGLLRIFEALAPPAPVPEKLPALPAAPEAPPAELVPWEGMFAFPSPEEAVPFGPPALPVEAPEAPFMFEPSPPVPTEPRRYRFIRVPGAPPFRAPAPGEFAIHLRNRFFLDRMFDEILRSRRTEGWQQALTERARSGEPLVMPIEPVVHREIYTDFASLFNIPMETIEPYTRDPDAPRRFVEEVVRPHIDVLTESFDLLKPRELAGYFSVGEDRETGLWYLFYVEMMAPPYPQALRIPFRGKARE